MQIGLHLSDLYTNDLCVAMQMSRRIDLSDFTLFQEGEEKFPVGWSPTIKLFTIADSKRGASNRTGPFAMSACVKTFPGMLLRSILPALRTPPEHHMPYQC
jgi:hypothetical protein